MYNCESTFSEHDISPKSTSSKERKNEKFSQFVLWHQRFPLRLGISDLIFSLTHNNDRNPPLEFFNILCLSVSETENFPPFLFFLFLLHFFVFPRLLQNMQCKGKDEYSLSEYHSCTAHFSRNWWLHLDGRKEVKSMLARIENGRHGMGWIGRID